jgi:hypothetical protein
MKRNKTPDYRGQHVFGVPPLIHVQRTGQPLPQSIQQAMRYLRSQCLDQVSPPQEAYREMVSGDGGRPRAKQELLWFSLGLGCPPAQQEWSQSSPPYSQNLCGSFLLARAL